MAPKYGRVVAFQRLKTVENSYHQHERCSDLTADALVYWKSGHLREMIAHVGMTVYKIRYVEEICQICCDILGTTACLA